MRVIREGTVVRSRTAHGQGSCCMAHVCVARSGRWVVGFAAGATKITHEPRSLLTWSDDAGATWREPFEPLPDVPALGGRPGRWRKITCTAMPDGRLAAILYWMDVSRTDRTFFDEATESLLDSQLFLSLSEDEGETWSPPRHVNPDCYRDMARPITGPMLVTADGRWVCQFELNKRYDVPGKWTHKPVLAFSSDEGRTWGDCVLPADDPSDRIFYWDQRPSVLGDSGFMLNAYWTYDRVASRYHNMHASASRDHGRTWSAVWDTGLPGQAAPPQRLHDGRIVLVHVDRTAEPTITAAASADDGRTFDVDNKLVIHRRSDVGRQETPEDKKKMGDAWDEMSAYSVGLPDTTPLPDGNVLVTWYTGPSSDRTDIAWAVVG